MEKIILVLFFFASLAASAQSPSVILEVSPSSSTTNHVDTMYLNGTGDSIIYLIGGTRYAIAKGGGGSGENTNFTKMTYYAVPIPGVSQIQMKGFGNNAFVATQGTGSNLPVSSTSIQTSMPRFRYSTAGSASGERAGYRTNNVLWRGNASGLGGFDFLGRVGFPAISTNRQIYFGLGAGTAGYAGTINPSTQVNIIGIGVDATDVNWQLMTNDGTGTATKTNTGIPVSATDVLSLRVSCSANGSSYNVTFKTSSGGNYTTTVSTDIPAADQFLNFFVQNQTNSDTFVAQADFYYAYAESNVGF